MGDEKWKARGALAAGGVAALLASSCCLGPLLLVSLGLSGAWVGSLGAMELYRPLLIGLSITALAFAGRSIFQPAHRCEGGAICSSPRARRVYHITFWVVAVLVMTAIGYPLVLPMFY